MSKETKFYNYSIISRKYNEGYIMIQWPPHSKIICMSSTGDILAKSKRSRLDLSDSLMLRRAGISPLFCSIEVSTRDKNWIVWNSKNVKKIESYIIYDLEFDGYKVKINRISKPGKTLCKNPFKWNLEITVGCSEEDPEFSPKRKQSGSRFNSARSDASIKSIKRSIEKIFGLPRGSVCLLTPNNKKAKSDSSIKKLRESWKES